ncbi:two-component system, OmpR family, sensor kinase [Actinacidiphila rubida]|uniref:histidine kinase n=2 Tax=Actinacidiphila rubida TaxID=310780 RepID=A0A1H8RRA2_9ACTN|nr:HAMP domain-containing sensor histidine kinase [Actinacidiphila rubida]SEO69001.1 two-component system, OmpR family, sensor kinase [Actinacidiphila rubida]
MTRTTPGRLLRAVPRDLVPRTLRARLTCGLVVLLAISCAAVGIAAVLGLRAFLTERLDQQLAEAGGRFPASLEHASKSPGTPREPDADNQHVDTRRQAPGTFGARLLHGQVTSAAVVRSGADTSVDLAPSDLRAIASVPVDGHCHALDLSALGDYRVSAIAGDDGDVLVTGMPMSSVEDAASRLVAIEAAVFGGALVVAGAAGAFWVRWSLRPLSRVATTAASVTALPLDSGEVVLPDRVPAADTDPRTEVGRVGAALNRMLGHVEGALAKRQAGEERLRRFAADASHELRTPVATIRGHAELALRHPEPVPAGVTRALDRIAAESARMSGMVDDLLLLARLDAGRPLARETVDLTRLVLDAVDDARAAGPGHRWNLDLPEEPVAITGDAHRLHQIAANLLANARAHTPAGTRVTVQLRQTPDATELAVVDNGPGIPEALRDTVFERFTRAPQPRSGHGSGLGLSIVSAVAAAHGGTAHVTSRPGETTFRVVLPADPPAEDAAGRP